MANWMVACTISTLAMLGKTCAKVMANGEKIRNYQGLMGNYSYSRKEREGLGSSSVVWHQYKGGKLELLK